MGMSRMIEFSPDGLYEPQDLRIFYSRALGSRVVELEELHRLALELFAEHRESVRTHRGRMDVWISGAYANTKSGRPAKYVALILRFGNGSHSLSVFLRAEAKLAPSRMSVCAESVAELSALIGVQGDRWVL